MFVWGSPKHWNMHTALPAETNFELSSCEFATSQKNFYTFIFPIESNLQVILWHEERYQRYTIQQFELSVLIKAYVIHIMLHCYKLGPSLMLYNKVDIKNNIFDPSYARSWSRQIGCSYVLSAISYQKPLKTMICLSVSAVSTGSSMTLKYNRPGLVR